MGGAIFTHRGDVRLINVTATGNVANGASGLGAVLFNLNGEVSISFSTLANNTVIGSNGGTSASGMGNASVYSLAYGNRIEDGNANVVLLNIRNSIIFGTVGSNGAGSQDVVNNAVAGNNAANTGNTAILNYAQNNLIGLSQSVSSGAGATASQYSPPTSSSNPMLDGLADNGGPTLTMMPAVGSPAIDAAGVCTSAGGFDQRSIRRPYGFICDLGAVEAAPINGACGTADGIAALSAPSTNLCSSGTAGSVTTGSTAYGWSCTGANTGSTATCSAPRQYIVTAANVTGGTVVCTSPVTAGSTSTCTVTPNSGYVLTRINGDANCAAAAAGTASPFTTGAVTANCTVTATLMPIVNGACGTAAGVAVLNAPSANLCSSGTAGSVTSSSTAYGWSCTGANTGSTATCSAPRQYTVAAAVVAGGTVSCTNATVVSGGSSTCTVTTTNAGYRFAGWSGDPQCTGATCAMTNITANKNVVANFAQPSLTLAMSAATVPATSPTSVAKGEAFSYAIAVTNSGIVASGDNTQVTDTVPPGVTIAQISAGSGWSCNPTGAGSWAGVTTITCTRAAGVPANTTETVMTLQATKTSIADITNTANITSGDLACPAADRCVSSAEVKDASQPSLTLAKAAATSPPTSPTSAAKDGTFSYVVTVSNSGPVASAANTVVTDIVPAGVTITQITTGSSDWSCNPTGAGSWANATTITCTRAVGVPAAVDDTHPTTETVMTLQATKTSVADVTNTATITSGDTACPAAGRCVSSATVKDASQPGLTLSMTADRASAGPYTDVTYTLAVSNNGPVASAANTVVTDTVPSGLTVKSVANGAGWSCTPTTGAGPVSITCTKAAGVSADTSEQVATIVATKTIDAAVTNSASVTSGDPGCAGGAPAARCNTSAAVAGPVTPVPTFSQWALMLLTTLLAGLTWVVQRRYLRGTA